VVVHTSRATGAKHRRDGQAVVELQAHPDPELACPLPRPGDDRGGTVGLEAGYRCLFGAEERADLLGDRREDVGRGRIVRDRRRQAPQRGLFGGEHAQLVAGPATWQAWAAELPHDVGLLVPDRLRERVAPGREDQLASAGRHLEPRAAQPPSGIVGDESAGRGHERAAITAAGDAPLIARTQAFVALLHAVTEMAFDGSGGGHGDRQAVRVDVLLQAGQVDHAEQLARLRVMDGGRRAGPGLHYLDEVLRGEDLHCVIRRQGGPDSVGPSAVLAPQGALREVHRVGRLRANPGVALELEQHPRRVAHDDQVL